MRSLKRKEKGFTLIELLIVVAILGVLAAVVIPNVGRFIGRGQAEAAATELQNIQTAVISAMVDNQLSTLPNPVTVATKDMAVFPDATSVVVTVKVKDPAGNSYQIGDKNGYLLYTHDITADNLQTNLVNYVATRYTKGTYTVNASGTVAQASTGY